MSAQLHLTRRQLLHASAASAAGVAGLNLLTTSAQEAGENPLIGDLEGPTIITDPAQFPTAFQEAPQFAEMVASGDLPPVAERIGQDPLVVQPLDEIGTYGGTWRRGFTGPGDKWNGYRTASGPDSLLGWHWDGQTVIPNIAKSFEFGDDGRTLTLQLRRGMRWSDGEPFTADDFVFWYEDMYGNDELVPVKTTSMEINGQPGTLEKIDEATIRFSFPDPYFLITDQLAGAGALCGQAIQGLAGNGAYAPAHYLKQFHPTYAEQAEIDRLVEEAQVDNWVTLFKQKNDWALNPDLPVLTPWVTTTPINTPTWTLTRNPYSIWVDTDGNQLPYLDEIVMTLAENLEVINLRAIAGEYDFQARHIDMGKLPVLLENREQGDYTVYLDTGDYGSDMCLYVNQTYEQDAEIGQWLANVDFRRALALGIDRDQINETFFLGTGTGGSPVPADGNKYNPGPEYRTMWHTYDLEQANAILDEIGLSEKDGDGFRQRADGQGRLRIEVVTVGAQFIQFTQIAEVIRQNWEGIGIAMDIKEVERGLGDTMITANEVQIYAWSNDGSENVFLSPKGIFPTGGGDSMGPLYGQWYESDGAQGKEPPAHIIEVIEQYRAGFGAPEEERIAIGKALWAQAVDQVNAIGIVGLSAASMGVRVVKNNVGNVPARQYSSPITKNPAISCPATFYFKS